MKNMFFVLSIFLMTSAAASFAQARGGGSGVMLTANAFMYNATVDNGTTKTDSKSSIYDLKLGYLSGSGLYLGGIYSLRHSESPSQDGRALGGSVGYFGASGFFVKGHYIASAEWEDYKEGTGIQADFGYITNVTGSFVVGVELTYREIEYKKNDLIPGFDKLKFSETFPMLTVGFVF